MSRMSRLPRVFKWSTDSELCLVSVCLFVKFEFLELLTQLKIVHFNVVVVVDAIVNFVVVVIVVYMADVVLFWWWSSGYIVLVKISC